MVVDDDERLRDMLAKTLSHNFPSLDFRTANDGMDAYNKIKEQKPDILYTDVTMSRENLSLNGDALLERLVREGINIPTFVLSGELIRLPDPVVRAVFYSTRMYTNEQKGRFELAERPTIEAQRSYLSGILQEQETKQTLRRDPNPSYDLGFTALEKPFGLDVIIDRTRRVLEYYSPQS